MTEKEDVPLKDDNTNSGERKAYEALQVEYSDMASWYDSIWNDYLNKTFVRPLHLVATIISEKWKLQNETADKKPITVVDVACGTGEFVKRLQATTITKANEEQDKDIPIVSYYGVEPCLEMLQLAQQKILIYESSTTWIQSTAEALTLGDASVDIVCSTSSFHFFRNKPLALAQMYRVLKPNGDGGVGGHLVITDWCADALIVRLYHLFERVRWNLWGRYSHRYPGPLRSAAMQQLVEEAGFQNVSVETYTVRFWTIIFWGMQTVTATKA